MYNNTVTQFARVTIRWVLHDVYSLGKKQKKQLQGLCRLQAELSRLDPGMTGDVGGTEQLVVAVDWT